MNGTKEKMSEYSADDFAAAKCIYKKLYKQQVNVISESETFPCISAEEISEKIGELERKIKDSKHSAKGLELAKKMILTGYNPQKDRLMELAEVLQILKLCPVERDVL